MEINIKEDWRRNGGRVITVSFIGMVLFYWVVYFYTRILPGADSSGCRIVYMGPSYARIKSFDESHTKYASKYSLYLYREQGKDPVPDENRGYELLDGIPILFIPGNAGSYRQIRSIASETANLYFEDNAQYDNSKGRNYDFFTADFNEDFTAFHGRTLLDQADYLNEAVKFILGLYASNKHAPESVVILAHSMGGVVARTMITLPNYSENSINTILTLASPHAAAPLTFDGDILKIYSAIDRFWMDGFSSERNDTTSEIAKRRLENMSLISITGGILDSVLPADYTTLGYLVPPTNGFTVFTTGIPNVWTPIDHLAIVWCAQLRFRVSKTLLEIADYESPSKTQSLEARMAIMRRNLLSGFESYAMQDKEASDTETDSLYFRLSKNRLNSIKNGKKLKLTAKGEDDSEEHYMNIFTIPKDSNSHFNLLTNIGISQWNPLESSEIAVLLCNNYEFQDDGRFIDLTSENTIEYVALKCKDINRDVLVVPSSSEQVSSLADSSLGGDYDPFHALHYNSSALAQYDAIIVAASSKNVEKDDFVIADLTENTNAELGKSLGTLIRRGADISLPTDRPLAVNINIPGAWSSIVAYKVELVHPKSKEGSKGPFSPFVRQWSDEPYEVKWHINTDRDNVLHLSMHGIAPFTPYKVKEKQGLNIELWSDSTDDESPLEIVLKIDLFASLRLLVLRYRLAIVAYCSSISLLALLYQLSYFETHSKFPSFQYGLIQICSPKNLAVICFVLSVATPMAKINFVQKLLNMIDPVVFKDANEINISLHKDFRLNSFFLGLEESCLWFIGPLFLFIGVFLVYVTYIIALCVSFWVSPLATRFIRKQTSKSIEYSAKGALLTRRILFSLILLALVSFYMPYQFVYVVCCVVQLITVLRLRGGNLDASVFNYQCSLLILMLWILPVNIPTLIVFAHNISINWRTPFSSHHNFLSIMPVLMLMERNASFARFPKAAARSKITKCFIGYFIFYSLVYGIRHTYWLHHLFNLLCAWLLVFHLAHTEAPEAEKLT